MPVAVSSRPQAGRQVDERTRDAGGTAAWTAIQQPCSYWCGAGHRQHLWVFTGEILRLGARSRSRSAARLSRQGLAMPRAFGLGGSEKPQGVHDTPASALRVIRATIGSPSGASRVRCAQLSTSALGQPSRDHPDPGMAGGPLGEACGAQTKGARSGGFWLMRGKYLRRSERGRAGAESQWWTSPRTSRLD